VAAGETADVDDLALLAAGRGGDRELGAALFRRHAASITRFFRSKVPDAAEDCDYTETVLRALFTRHPSLQLLSVEESPPQRPQGDNRSWLIARASKRAAHAGSGAVG
jgi:hypothetical protein